MADDQLTPEQMMEKINQLSKDVEKLSSENKSLKETNDKNSVSLQKAREINSELLLRIGVPAEENKNDGNESEKEDTFENLMRETLDKVLERFHKKE